MRSVISMLAYRRDWSLRAPGRLCRHGVRDYTNPWKRTSGWSSTQSELHCGRDEDSTPMLFIMIEWQLGNKDLPKEMSRTI